MKNVEKNIVQLLTQRKQTLSIAESCTGGWIGQRMTSVPGAFRVFGLGVISYSAEAKKEILKVSPKLIQKHGVVSEEVAVAMAKGVQKLSRSHYAISVTGIAGPTGATPTKSVGMVCLSLISKGGKNIKKRTLHLKGSRRGIRKEASTQILNWLYQSLVR